MMINGSIETKKTCWKFYDDDDHKANTRSNMTVFFSNINKNHIIIKKKVL